MTHYSPPAWSATGRNVYDLSLEVIKRGVTVERLPLCRPQPARSYVVLGRMATACDVALAHPSISRVHAVLQFDAQGALFLYDAGSTHGCYVNKRRVDAEDFVRVHIGDVIAFGDSTRLYVVCGPAELLPPEYESLHVIKLREKLDKHQRGRGDREALEEERGVSWGLREDAEDEKESEDDETDAATTREALPDYLRNLKEDDQPYTSSVGPSEIHEKDQRLYQQLQTRIRKMENLKVERARILAKQNQLNGLSEGQQNTLDRNEQRIDVLMKEIDDLEGRIHAKNDQRVKSRGANGTVARKKRNMNEELYGYSSDEDDFYDRTKANQQKIIARKRNVTDLVGTGGVTTAATPARSTESKVLTEDSIKANVKELEAELAKVQDELTAVSSVTAEERQATHGDSESQTGTDTLDSFMTATTTQLHKSKVDALATRKEEVEMELRRQRQLLVVATPALAAIPISQSCDTSSIDHAKSILSASGSTDTSSAPESACVEKVIELDTAKTQDSALERTSTAAETLAVASAGPSTQPLASLKMKPVSQETDVEPVAPKRRRVVGPARVPPPQSKPKTGDEHPGGDASVLEGGDQVWVPPTNQTGDGRTKLNDKYGY